MTLIFLAGDVTIVLVLVKKEKTVQKYQSPSPKVNRRLSPSRAATVANLEVIELSFQLLDSAMG
jgi:hypothetical protein